MGTDERLVLSLKCCQGYRSSYWYQRSWNFSFRILTWLWKFVDLYKFWFYTLKPGISPWNHRNDFQNRGSANVSVMTPWWKENCDLTANHLQIHPSLPLASSISPLSLFVIFAVRLGWSWKEYSKIRNYSQDGIQRVL